MVHQTEMTSHKNLKPSRLGDPRSMFSEINKEDKIARSRDMTDLCLKILQLTVHQT